MAEEVFKFNQGETVTLWAETRNQSDTLTAPSEGIKVTITDPDGTEQVTEGAMSTDDTGIYYYYYTIGASATLGFWQARYKAQSGTGGSARLTYVDGGFEVVS